MNGGPRVAIVHYHLRPGGVTTVIARAAAILAEQGMRAAVLSGDAPPPDWPTGLCRQVEGLDYASHVTADGLCANLRAVARAALGGAPDVWHVHNHAIGKSAVLPLALERLAGAHERLLLQIHDFAEDGRPGNYRLLLEQAGGGDPARLGRCLYPQAPHVHYAVLSSRDRAALVAAGTPVERVHVLGNPVFFGGEPPAARLPSSPPLFVYPTRAIRRKNVGEFLLWALLADAGTRWATTLAPTSPVDRAPYERWVAWALGRGLAVEFGVGAAVPAPITELLGDATGVVSTSIAEGFGLSFLEPWLLERPVLGRDIPEVTCDFKQAGVDLAHLYARLDVPLAWVGESALREACRRGLEVQYAAYERALPAGAVEQTWADIVRGDAVDFGRLDEALQARVLEPLLRDAGRRRELRPALLAQPAPGVLARNAAAVAAGYGRAAYGARLAQAYAAVAGAAPGPVTGLSVDRLLDNFLGPARLALLRT